MEKIKYVPDSENEIHDLASFKDMGVNVVTPIARFAPDVALGVVTTLADVVRAGHASAQARSRDADGIVRAQMFEEGAVYMVAPPFEGFTADRYLMDFYDVLDRNLCARMHMHTGMRYVRMMTGPGTQIRVSGLSAFRIAGTTGVSPFEPVQFTDDLPDEATGVQVTRHNLIVPPCAWVDMQIPRGTAHQFNAVGPHAVIDTVHPEESIEILREDASRVSMMAQTVFLQAQQPPAEFCVNPLD